MSWNQAHIITFSYFCLVFVRHCEMLWKRVWIFFNSSGERCFSNFFQGTVDSLNINFCILPIRSWRLEKRHSLGGKHFWRLKTALKYQLAASERPWPLFGWFWPCLALTSSLIVSHSDKFIFRLPCPLCGGCANQSSSDETQGWNQESWGIVRCIWYFRNLWLSVRELHGVQASPADLFTLRRRYRCYTSPCVGAVSG